MPRDILRALCDLLAGRGDTRACWFGLWDGYGWDSDIVTIGWPEGLRPDPETVRAAEAEANKPAFGPDVLRGPELGLPLRNYLVFQGPLEAALAFPDYHGQTVAPDLIWPSGRAWFIATDTDLYSTYLGGSQALIRDLATSDRLTTEVVHAGHPLEQDG
jgi:hypothetical protein